MLISASIAAIASASVLSFGNQALAADIHTAADTNNRTTQSQTKPKQAVKVAAETAPAPPAAPAPTVVTVQAGDYLEKIALAHSTTSQRLFYANTNVVAPDVIYPGQQLRVPTADEALTPRELPAPPQPVVAPAPAPVAAAPRPVASPAPVTPAPAVSGGGVWDSLAACESGGNWAINTGNGYYGGLQFSLSSWRAVGGSGLPSQASREEQILRGQMLQSRGGWGNWPACSAKLGLR